MDVLNDQKKTHSKNIATQRSHTKHNKEEKKALKARY